MFQSKYKPKKFICSFLNEVKKEVFIDLDTPTFVRYMEKLLPLIFCVFFFVRIEWEVETNFQIPIWIVIFICIIYVVFLIGPYLIITNRYSKFFSTFLNDAFIILRNFIRKDMDTVINYYRGYIRNFIIPLFRYLYSQRITIIFLIILLIIDSFDWKTKIIDHNAQQFFSIFTMLIISRCTLALSFYSSESVNLSMNCVRLLFLLLKFLADISPDIANLANDPITNAVVASLAFDAVFQGVKKVYTKH